MLNSAERLIEPSGTMDVGDDEVPVVVFESWLTCHKIIVTFMFNCRCYLAFGIHISELSVQVFFLSQDMSTTFATEESVKWPKQVAIVGYHTQKQLEASSMLVNWQLELVCA